MGGRDGRATGKTLVEGAPPSQSLPKAHQSWTSRSSLYGRIADIPRWAEARAERREQQDATLLFLRNEPADRPPDILASRSPKRVRAASRDQMI